MIGDLLYNWAQGNLLLLLLMMAIIFYLDSMILTILPEVFLVFFYFTPHPGISPLVWAVLLLAMANLGDVAGNMTVYLLFKKWKWFQKRVGDKLKKYVNVLMLKDEKLILLNRLAPALPMCGVFAAVCGWNPKKVAWYIYLGGVIKYSFMLVIFGIFEYAFDKDLAQWLAILAAFVFVGFSGAMAMREKKRQEASGLIGNVEKIQNGEEESPASGK